MKGRSKKKKKPKMIFDKNERSYSNKTASVGGPFIIDLIS